MNTFAIIFACTVSFALGAGIVFIGRKIDEKDFERVLGERDEAYKLCRKAIDMLKESNKVNEDYEHIIDRKVSALDPKDYFGGF